MALAERVADEPAPDAARCGVDTVEIARIERLLAETPPEGLSALFSPQELADAALFLAEGWAASGETLYIDSGQHLLAQPRDVLFMARGL